MSNETIPVIPNDEEQRSLRGSGLILAAATDDSDFTKTKEGYAARLEGILDTPLTPENFSTYADDAYNQVVSLVGDMVSKSPYRDLPLPSRLIEDYAGDSYGIDIGKVLDTLISKVEETSDIKKFVANTGRDNDIYVPPQVLSPGIESGKGEFTEAGVALKLESILFLLKEIHGIDLQDREQIVVTRGTVDKNMMRNEPYYSIQIPGLNRTILVCNEKGNITYILDSEMLAESMPDLNLEITDLDKGAIDQLIKDNPSLGARIQHTVKYITKIEDSLYEIASFDEAAIDEDPGAKEVSLLTYVEKAPDDYLSINGIYKEMGIGPKTLREIIGELGDDFGKALDAKFGTRVAPGYSPVQIEKIRTIVESRRAPEGYLTIGSIADKFGKGQENIKKIIDDLGDDFGKAKKVSLTNGLGSVYSPEQIEKVHAELESQGFFTEAPEDYLTATGIAEEFGLSISTVYNYVNKVGGNLGDDFGKALNALDGTGGVSKWFSPEQIEKVHAELESQGFFTEAPEGYLTIDGIVEEFGLSISTVYNYVKKVGSKLGDDFGKALNAKDGTGGVSKWFSPEQIEKVHAELESQGFFTEAPEDYLTIDGIVEEFGLSKNSVYKYVKKVGSKLGDDFGKALNAKNKYNGVSKWFSPEQIEKVHAELESQGFFTEAPEDYLTTTGITEEYGLGRGKINRAIGKLGDDFGKALNAKNKYNGVSKWFSPEQIEKILTEAKKAKPTK